MLKEKNRKLKDNPDYLQILLEIQLDIGKIKAELKWHRWLITTIIVLLITMLTKLHLGV